MGNDIGEAVQKNMKFTLDLADKILLSAGDDSSDAFAKAVGTLAQVIHVLTPEDQREATLNGTMRSLRAYLGMLDSISPPQQD